MAGSLTLTSPPFSPITPKSPTFNFTVPTPDKTKPAPWEGLLMGDPGSDYDQHANRQSIVRYMLTLGKTHGQRRKMANWRDNQVFAPDPDDEETMEAEGDGKTDAVKKVAVVKTDEVKVKEEMKEGKMGWGMDEEVMCWEATTEKDALKEKNDSKTEVTEFGLREDESWTVSRATVG